MGEQKFNFKNRMLMFFFLLLVGSTYKIKPQLINQKNGETEELRTGKTVQKALLCCSHHP